MSELSPLEITGNERLILGHALALVIRGAQVCGMDEESRAREVELLALCAKLIGRMQ